MRIFIAGILGFCGSHLSDAFKAAGHHVTGIDNQCQSAVLAKETTADYIILDSLENLPRYNTEKYDYVFHCASPAGPSRIAPGYALRQIIEGTVQGLDFAARVGARFVKFSSSEVYGWENCTLSEDIGCLVDPRYDARSEYSLGFMSAECLCFNHPHPDVQILRLFNVVGPRQSAKAGVVLPRFCQQIRNGQALTIIGDGSQRRTFTDVSDLVSFCMTLLNKWPGKKGIWNVANPANETSILQLASLVATVAGVPTRARSIDGSEIALGYRDAPSKGKVSIEKARKQGWTPQVPLREIVERAWNATL